MHRFKADLDVIGSLAQEFGGFLDYAQAAAKAEGLNPPALTFRTSSIFFSHASGNGHEGSLSLHMFLPNRQSLVTYLTPNLSAQLLANIKDALDSLPTPPPSYPSVLGPLTPTTPGVLRSVSTRIHFGQEYPVDILEAFGLLMVRANFLEESLIKLMSVLGRLPLDQAEAQFYSTVNLNSRIAMVRALTVDSDDLTEADINIATAA